MHLAKASSSPMTTVCSANTQLSGVAFSFSFPWVLTDKGCNGHGCPEYYIRLTVSNDINFSPDLDTFSFPIHDCCYPPFASPELISKSQCFAWLSCFSAFVSLLFRYKHSFQNTGIRKVQVHLPGPSNKAHPVNPESFSTKKTPVCFSFSFSLGC